MFFEAVKDKPAEQTKWQAMEIASKLVKVKKCFLFILISILFSCNSSNENIKEIADSKKENNIPFYEINLSDTIEINTPTEFEIKLIYPNQKILSDYCKLPPKANCLKV